MWRFTPEDERRYDTLAGRVPVAPHSGLAVRHDSTALRLARRLSRWRDGADPRKGALHRADAIKVEDRLVRDFAAAALSEAHLLNQPKPRNG